MSGCGVCGFWRAGSDGNESIHVVAEVADEEERAVVAACEDEDDYGDPEVKVATLLKTL